MDKQIESRDILKRCYAFANELAIQVSRKEMLDVGVVEVAKKIASLTAQVNELADILKTVGMDKEAIQKEFDVISKQEKATKEKDKNPNEDNQKN